MLGRHVEDCVFLPCLPVHCLCTHFVISCGTMQSHSAARASLCMNMVQHADRCSMLPPTTERRLCSHLSGLKRPQGGAPGGVNGETYPFHGSEALVTEKFGKNIGLLRQREVHEEDHEVRRLLVATPRASSVTRSTSTLGRRSPSTTRQGRPRKNQGAI